MKICRHPCNFTERLLARAYSVQTKSYNVFGVYVHWHTCINDHEKENSECSIKCEKCDSHLTGIDDGKA